MVLEALAAVGLAGNICQFIDFTCQLFNTTASIHRSYTGSSTDVQQLDYITKELQQWCRRLATYRANGSQQLGLQSNKSLYDLGENCETAATQLLSVTNALRAKNPGSRWNSFKAALSAAWSESQIREMERRLNSFRLELILELGLMQR
jgi:hypothetical protein